MIWTLHLIGRNATLPTPCLCWGTTVTKAKTWTRWPTSHQHAQGCEPCKPQQSAPAPKS